MSDKPTYYIQQRRVGKTEWGPPFEKMESLEEAMKTLRNYRRTVLATQVEFRLVEMREVQE